MGHRHPANPRLFSRASILTCLVGLSLAACGSPGPAPATGPPVIRGEDLGLRHPLNGRIWDVRGGEFVSFGVMVERLAGARFISLGEKHDNKYHHIHQARVLQALTRRGRRPAVAWEMIPSTVQPTLTAYLRQKAANTAGVGSAVKWQASGWPPWSIYEPIARAALAARLPMIAAGIQRRELFKAIHGAGSHTGPASRPATRALPAEAVADLEKTVRESHCGHASGQMVRMMVKAQQHRDRHMATQMVRAGGPYGVVLIAGNGHARKDRGVPFYLPAVPGERLASLGILEVRQGLVRPAAYVHSRPDQPFDYLWFTVRVDNEDPCQKFKQQLERMKSRRSHSPTRKRKSPAPGS